MVTLKRTIIDFDVGDVSDPDITANLHIDSWRKNNQDAFDFLLEKSTGQVTINRQPNPSIMGHHYSVIAEMSEQDWFIYRMRFE